MSTGGIAGSTASGAATGGSMGGPWGAVIGGAIGLGTGIAADDAGKDLDAAALANVHQALANYDGVIPPEVRAVLVSDLQQQGLYTPEVEEALNAGQSQVAGIKEDPAIKNAQMAALTQLGQASRTGLRPEDRLAMITGNNNIARDVNAKQGSLLQQLQARGLSGPDAQVAMQLQASQQGANSASDNADQMNALAAQNALTALGKYNDMSGNVRSQDFQNDSARASAADQFQRFNVANRQNIANTNTGNRNQAQAQNLAEAQRISNTNTDNARAEAVRQENAKQARYENQVAVAAGKANAMNGVASVVGGQAADSRQGTANAIQGGLGALSTLLTSSGPDKKSPTAGPASQNSQDAFDSQGSA